MKSSSLNLILTFALAAFVFQSVGVQSADAQERMFGNGRFLKRVFGDLVPQSEPVKAPTPALAAKKGNSKPVRQPLAGHRKMLSQPWQINRFVLVTLSRDRFNLIVARPIAHQSTDCQNHQ